MKFENTQVFNFKGAFNGMRNPMNSWDKSDSYFGLINIEYDDYLVDEVITSWVKNQIKLDQKPIEEYSKEWDILCDKYWEWWYNKVILLRDGDIFDVACIGPNDLKLAQKLIRAGSEHAKFLRQIMVSVDITAPLYFYKEFDTYKVGTVANSTSTMHKLSSTPITLECFEIDDYNPRLQLIDPQMLDVRINSWIEQLEQLRQLYLQTKDIAYWKELIRWLPESWLQTRTVTMNYANLRNIYSQRKNHKLTEWHSFCDWIETLPYNFELIILDLD